MKRLRRDHRTDAAAVAVPALVPFPSVVRTDAAAAPFTCTPSTRPVADAAARASADLAAALAPVLGRTLFRSPEIAWAGR